MTIQKTTRKKFLDGRISLRAFADSCKIGRLSALKRVQAICHRTFQRPGAVPAKTLIQSLQPLNQVGNMVSRIHAACGLTKMSTATKGAMVISRAPAIFAQ